MFNNLRTSGHGILTRIMLIFIVLSFALWGIGDIFRSGGTDMTVATVGTVKVSMQEYAQAIKNRHEELRQRLGKMYNPELVKKLGIESQALEGIINRSLLHQEAIAQGIAVGEDSIIEHIANSPEFRDSNGRFSKETYQALLRANRMSEKDYVKAMSEQIASKLLLTTVASGITAPEDLVYALYRARAQKRKAALLTIPMSAVANDFKPSEADIKTYYDNNSRNYLMPEYRAFSYVELTPDDVKASITVSDAEIQKAYDERAESFKQPERRVIEQLLYEKKEDAEKANEALVEGKTLKEVAASSKPLNKDKLLLGELTKERVPVGADEVFTLKEGAISKPYESPFGWHIMQVTKILPAGQKSLAEVRDILVSEITARSSHDALFKLSNSFEDMLGGGATFGDAVQKIGKKIIVVEAVTKEGQKTSGGKAELPAIGNLLEVVFATAQGDHSRMMQSDNGTYFMVQVNAIEKEHARPLAEVEADVKTALMREEQDKKIKLLADQIAANLTSGKKLEEALVGKNVTAVFEPAGVLQRNMDIVEEGKLKGRALSQELVKDLFSRKVGEYTAAHVLPEGGYMIATVQQVIPAPDILSEPTDGTSPLAAIREELNESLANETQYYFLQYLRKKYSVIINQDAIKAFADANG